MTDGKSNLELALAFQLKAVGLLGAREHRFHPSRRYRFDFAWPESKLAAEVEGVTFEGKGKDTKLGGRHVSVKGFESDAEKYNEAAILGWRVLRVTARMIKRGQALLYIERALGVRE